MPNWKSVGDYCLLFSKLVFYLKVNKNIRCVPNLKLTFGISESVRDTKTENNGKKGF